MLRAIAPIRSRHSHYSMQRWSTCDYLAAVTRWNVQTAEQLENWLVHCIVISIHSIETGHVLDEPKNKGERIPPPKGRPGLPTRTLPVAVHLQLTLSRDSLLSPYKYMQGLEPGIICSLSRACPCQMHATSRVRVLQGKRMVQSLFGMPKCSPSYMYTLLE